MEDMLPWALRLRFFFTSFYILCLLRHGLASLNDCCVVFFVYLRRAFLLGCCKDGTEQELAAIFF